ncbi:vacuolar protein sorting-associated protein 26C isoform X2 [Amyelois transitella]|uniref:vacuolar protein sorting-associated protein 26C isoform X2 n=1 Tax=Amyelois transitella TaxID=680683 RepID=UPI00298F809D|nr:vacuolar protein sorting-associated protein 26C isoform X2 [Amyelois transitella]
MSTNLSIVLKRASKVYHEGETIAGVAVVESNGDVRHEGLTLLVEGCVNLQLSTKNVGIFEAFSNSIKPLNLLYTSIELAPPGKIPTGITEIPFEVPLRARQAVSPGYPGLLETYHGVFVNIMYTIKCSMKRSFLNKPLNASCQFFVQYRQQEPPPLKPVRCEITPSSIRASAASAGRVSMPQFQVYAEIATTVCSLDKPITGKIRVEECSVPIKSIELQLVRVETCGCAEGYSRDEFELNIAVIFEDDYLVTENFPILLLRSK